MDSLEQRERDRGNSPTLQDVARAAGVSRQTVSNVLHAPERVRPATREHVAKHIELLGYQPNRQAQALVRSASRMIGYLIKPLATGALASINDRFLHGLAEAGRAADHHLVVFTAEDDDAEVETAGRLYRGGTVDTVVLHGLTADDPRPGALLQLGVPFVAFGRTEDGADAYRWIDVDNIAGVGAAVDHLVNRGHRRIGFVGWLAGDTIGDRRARGWRAAIDRYGLGPTCHALEARSEESIPAAVQSTFHLLEQRDPPTAIVAATDTLAVGAMQAAQRWGLEVGRDIAIVGFDDTPTAEALDLSSMRQPIELAGQRVMAALLGPDPVSSTDRLLEPQLIIRSSSARPAGQRR